VKKTNLTSPQLTHTNANRSTTELLVGESELLSLL